VTIICRNRQAQVLQETRISGMKKHFPLVAIIVIGLVALALYTMRGAIDRGEQMLLVVLIVITVIFWKLLQEN
jgi:hypothetical protein